MKPDPKKLDNFGKWLGNVPQEPLAKDFDQKFWKRFEAEKNLPLKPAGLSLAPTAFGAVLVCGLAIAFYFFGLRPEKPFIELASQGASGQILNPGDTLKTKPNDWMIIHLKGKYFVKLLPNSELVVKQLKNPLGFLKTKTILELKKGDVLVSIDKRSHYPLQIQTMRAFAMAKGTQFMVSAPTATKPFSWVGVLNGKVLVGKIGSESDSAVTPVLIEKRHKTSVYEDSKTLNSEILPDSTADDLEEMFQFSRKNQAILILSPGSGRIAELLKPVPLYIRLEKNNPNLKELETALKSLPLALHGKNRQIQMLWAKDFEKAVRGQSEVERLPLLLFLGAYYASLNEPDLALSIFENLPKDHPSKMYDSLALFAAAKIYEKKGILEKSQELSRKILSDYPSSPEARDAARLLKLTEN